jgi:hypothetical protein
MFNTIVGTGAASRYSSGSGSGKKMRLLAAPAPQHCFVQYRRYAVKQLEKRGAPGALSALHVPVFIYVDHLFHIRCVDYNERCPSDVLMLRCVVRMDIVSESI